MKRTSNCSEQWFFRKEVLCFIRQICACGPKFAGSEKGMVVSMETKIRDIQELKVHGRTTKNRNPLVLFWTASGFECNV